MKQFTRISADPNVTPMIDVLLVLIVVFMVVVMVGRRTIDVQLPVPCDGPCVGSDDAIVLQVLPGGNYLLNQRSVPHEDLQRILSVVYYGRPVKILSVAGRGDVRYGEVFRAMDVARTAGVKVISILPKDAPR